MKKDVVIVGGGVVGLATAAALAPLALNIAVVDAGEIDSSTQLSASTDSRIYAINHASEQFLSQLNAWQQIPPDRLSPYCKMWVWDENSQGVLDFNCQALARSSLGHIIEEHVLKHALLKVLSAAANVTLHSNRRLETIDSSEAYVHLSTRANTEHALDFTAKLVVGADGANSWIRQQCQFDCTATPYPHHAIVTNVVTELPHQKTAYQIFTKEGPLAFLPLPSVNHCSIVWSVPPTRANQLMELSDQGFIEQLEGAFQKKLGRIEHISKRVSFPLIERRVTPYVKPRIALVGDALHTIHPLAGLGVNLGLLDVTALAACVKNNLPSIGEYHVLRKYERQRKGHILTITTLMRLLQQAFSTNGLPGWLRGLGMNVISNTPAINKQIMRFASGVTADFER